MMSIRRTLTRGLFDVMPLIVIAGCGSGTPSTSGTGNPTPPPGVVETSAKVFDNSNSDALHNFPANPTVLELDDACKITRIRNVHWNNGQGTDTPGTITLEAEDGTTYGPWTTLGTEGQGGVPNVYWECTPDVSVPAGRYTVVDSDENTWSQNAASGGRGMSTIEGILSENASDILIRGIVQPSDEEQTFRWETDISVTVPAGLLESDQSLKIKRVNTPPPPGDDSLSEIAVVYDISLGDMHELEKPLEIQMAYDPSAFEAIGAASDVLSASYWDPALQTWINVPASVDPTTNVLIMQADHLSRYAGKMRVTPDYIRDDFFGLSYSKTAVEAETGTAVGWYEKPDPAVTDRSPSIPDYVEDVWYFVSKHRETYEDFTNAAGLTLRPLPTTYRDPMSDSLPFKHERVRLPIPVHVGGAGHPYRNKITGTIRISLDCATGPEVLSPLVAHELFHAVQNQYYNCAGMTLRKWWIEATAEYAAFRIAIPKAANMGGKITPRYLERPLDWSAGLLTSSEDTHIDHEYTTAYFIDFLVSMKGMDFIDMWTTMAKSWSTDMISVLNDYLDGRLPDYYREFAEYWIFGSASPVHGTLRSEGFAKAAFINETSWDPSAGPLTRTIQLEHYHGAVARVAIGGSATEGGSFSVGISGVSPDPHWDGPVAPGAGITALAYRFPGDSYDQSTRIGVLDSATDEIPFDASPGDVLYLLMLNSADSTERTQFTFKESGTKRFTITDAVECGDDDIDTSAERGLGVFARYTMVISAPMGNEPTTLEKVEDGNGQHHYNLSGSFSSAQDAVNIEVKVDIDVPNNTATEFGENWSTVWTLKSVQFEVISDNYLWHSLGDDDEESCSGTARTLTGASGETVKVTYTPSTGGASLRILGIAAWDGITTIDDVPDLPPYAESTTSRTCFGPEFVLSVSYPCYVDTP